RKAIIKRVLIISMFIAHLQIMFDSERKTKVACQAGAG
ncbi:MAG: hypothetical protein ACI9LY_000821, partial [Arenicella sp.]